MITPGIILIGWKRATGTASNFSKALGLPVNREALEPWALCRSPPRKKAHDRHAGIAFHDRDIFEGHGKLQRLRQTLS
jgi:hypothetical protein